MKRKKNEEYNESQINIFGFTFNIQNYILLIVLKKKQFIPSHFIYSFYAFQDI